MVNWSHETPLVYHADIYNWSPVLMGLVLTAWRRVRSMFGLLSACFSRCSRDYFSCCFKANKTQARDSQRRLKYTSTKTTKDTNWCFTISKDALMHWCIVITTLHSCYCTPNRIWVLIKAITPYCASLNKPLSALSGVLRTPRLTVVLCLARLSIAHQF